MGSYMGPLFCGGGSPIDLDGKQGMLDLVFFLVFDEDNRPQTILEH